MAVVCFGLISFRVMSIFKALKIYGSSNLLMIFKVRLLLGR